MVGKEAGGRGRRVREGIRVGVQFNPVGLGLSPTLAKAAVWAGFLFSNSVREKPRATRGVYREDAELGCHDALLAAVRSATVWPFPPVILSPHAGRALPPRNFNQETGWTCMHIPYLLAPRGWIHGPIEQPRASFWEWLLNSRTREVEMVTNQFQGPYGRSNIRCVDSRQPCFNEGTRKARSTLHDATATQSLKL